MIGRISATVTFEGMICHSFMNGDRTSFRTRLTHTAASLLHYLQEKGASLFSLGVFAISKQRH